LYAKAPPEKTPKAADPPMTELVLLRHGETVGQSSIRLYGATDIALSPVGEAQTARAAAALRDLAWVRVLSSPLQRARRTAEIVLAGRDGPPIERVDDWREVDFGAWEGWTWEEVQTRDPDHHREWQTRFAGFTYPGGESRVAFRARVEAATRGLGLERRGPVLAVLHKGVIKMVISTLTGMPGEQAAELPVPLGSLHRLRHADGAWTLESVGESAHLGDLDLGG
jgi:broad specificity phosphatase PhoE